jgi:hypothetical protein
VFLGRQGSGDGEEGKDEEEGEEMEVLGEGWKKCGRKGKEQLEGKGRKDKEMVKRKKGSGDMEGEWLRGKVYQEKTCRGDKRSCGKKVQYNCFA